MEEGPIKYGPIKEMWTIRYSRMDGKAVDEHLSQDGDFRIAADGLTDALEVLCAMGLKVEITYAPYDEHMAKVTELMRKRVP